MVSEETRQALAAQRQTMQASLDEAIRAVSERVWQEGAEQGYEDCENGVEEFTNPYTLEAVERAKREAERWGDSDEH